MTLELTEVVNFLGYSSTDELTEEDLKLLTSEIDIAKYFVSQRTGISQDSFDTYPDFKIAMLVLISYMFDERSMTVKEKDANKVIDDILSMHSINYL